MNIVKTHNILYVKADLVKVSNDIRIPGEVSI